MVLEHKEIQSLSDFFTELGKRREKGVYFYRINGYSEEIGRFLYDYYDAAGKCGVIGLPSICVITPPASSRITDAAA